MKVTLSTVFFLALATAVPGVLIAEPQEPGQEGLVGIEGEKEQTEQFQGSLVRVDTTAQTIAVADAAGQEKEFKYDDRTEVSGPENTIEGLATQQGTQVTVHFKQEGDENLAKKIEMSSEPAEGQGQQLP